MGQETLSTGMRCVCTGKGKLVEFVSGIHSPLSGIQGPMFHAMRFCIFQTWMAQLWNSGIHLALFLLVVIWLFKYYLLSAEVLAVLVSLILMRQGTF